MPTTYTIKLKNKSGSDHDYFLFVEAPIVKSGAQVYQNVYLSWPNVSGQTGDTTFICYTDYYAICGTSPNKALGAKVTVTTADSVPANICQGPTKLGSHVFMTGSGGRSVKFIDSAEKLDCSQLGAFQIDCIDFLANSECKLGFQSRRVRGQALLKMS